MSGPVTFRMSQCSNPGCRRQTGMPGFCCANCQRVSPAEPGHLSAGDHPAISHTQECDVLSLLAP